MYLAQRLQAPTRVQVEESWSKTVVQAVSFIRQNMDIASRVYLMMGGVVSWLFVAWFFTGGTPPIQSINIVLEYLGFAEIAALTTVSDWMITRNDAIIAAAMTFTVLAIMSTAGLLMSNVSLIADIRGPATAWICLAVLAQLAPFVTVIDIVLVAVPFFLVAIFSPRVNRRSGTSPNSDYVPALFLAYAAPVVAPVFAIWHVVVGPIFNLPNSRKIEPS